MKMRYLPLFSCTSPEQFSFLTSLFRFPSRRVMLVVRGWNHHEVHGAAKSKGNAGHVSGFPRETRDRKPVTDHVSGFPKAVPIASAHVCSDSTSWFSCTTGNPHSTNTGCQAPGGLRGQEKRYKNGKHAWIGR